MDVLIALSFRETATSDAQFPRSPQTGNSVSEKIPLLDNLVNKGNERPVAKCVSISESMITDTKIISRCYVFALKP